MTIHPTFTGDMAPEPKAPFRTSRAPHASLTTPVAPEAVAALPQAEPDPARRPPVAAQPEAPSPAAHHEAASPAAPAEADAPAMPETFLYESEHPVLAVPFSAIIEGEKLPGTGLSAVAAYVRTPGALDPETAGSRHMARLQFDFEGFSVALFPEVKVGPGPEGTVELSFVDPTGPHLRQLRYILNNFIAGEIVNLDGMMGYAGPTKPKHEKAAPDVNTWRGKMRRAASIAASIGVIVLAGNVIVNRYLTSYETRPVFISREGSEMRATSGGQITYLDPSADAGEVVYSVAANSGDVLNFRLPCDCGIAMAPGVYEGATILPGDQILTFFDDSVTVSMETQMSVEGLTKALAGNKVFLEVNDGRSIPVQVIQDGKTRAAAAEGELFLPVMLVPQEGHAISADDIGKSARLRLTKSVFGSLLN